MYRDNRVKRNHQLLSLFNHFTPRGGSLNIRSTNTISRWKEQARQVSRWRENGENESLSLSPSLSLSVFPQRQRNGATMPRAGLHGHGERFTKLVTLSARFVSRKIIHAAGRKSLKLSRGWPRSSANKPSPALSGITSAPWQFPRV